MPKLFALIVRLFLILQKSKRLRIFRDDEIIKVKVSASVISKFPTMVWYKLSFSLCSSTCFTRQCCYLLVVVNSTVNVILNVIFGKKIIYLVRSFLVFGIAQNQTNLTGTVY